MELLKQFSVSILPLVLIISIPFIAIILYRFIMRRSGLPRSKINVISESKNNQSKENLVQNEIPTNLSFHANNKINTKYYNWLIYSLIGSFILFGGFIYAKGGNIALLTVLLIEWIVGCCFSVLFLSTIISLIAKSLKKNWRNAFIGTAAIMLFIQACITIAKVQE